MDLLLSFASSFRDSVASGIVPHFLLERCAARGIRGNLERHRQGFRSNEELKKVFETFGAVTDAHIPVNRATGVAKGFAFVEFKRSNHADACAPGPRCRALGARVQKLSSVQQCESNIAW
jgi:hypothetical protein